MLSNSFVSFAPCFPSKEVYDVIQTISFDGNFHTAIEIIVTVNNIPIFLAHSGLLSRRIHFFKKPCFETMKHKNTIKIKIHNWTHKWHIFLVL